MATVIRFTLEEAETVGDGWFNCGPAALCAVTGMSPQMAMDVIPDFKSKHYTSPSMMATALKGLGISFNRQCSIASSGRPTLYERDSVRYPAFGLVRIQWGGPWCNLGVPIAASYYKTHWIAIDGNDRFDINAMCVGGWLPREAWETELVPWLLQEHVKKSDGTWWPTHCWEMDRPNGI